MLGRKFPKQFHGDDILVIAAHPDDEVLGLGTTLYRHRRAGEPVAVVYVTNGSGGEGASWKYRRNISQHISQIRYEESIKALSFIGIPEKSIHCLGFPDSGTHRYLKEIARDVLLIINETKPKMIYVHCIEGGHLDHDVVSFVVRSVCSKLGYSNVYEWAEYNRLQPLGERKITFSASKPNKHAEVTVDISSREFEMKRRMLACHHSQGVEEHFIMGEAVRKAATTELEKEFFQYSQFPYKRFRPIIDRFSRWIEKNVHGDAGHVDAETKQEKAVQSME
jgi:LmbE family N-acetylglucosaminyl deacetylase